MTALFILCTYNHIVDSIYEQKPVVQSKKLMLESEIASLKNLLAHQNQLTHQDLKNFDNKFGTNFLSIAPTSYTSTSPQDNQEILSSILEQEKNKKEAALSTIEQAGFLSYIPPWPMLIILALGVFFTRLISNLGDVTPTLIYRGYQKIKQCCVKS
ncbi:Uncharacterised protein [Legionella donaldsonii]|uniref:Uncharacterized protein n=1 Tax=Legionella donaldsonii TaxID=45060 RepID=A0A378J2I2_9GAMM|nr:hypothetical protein [Legionella donaldsonii]STX41825.1 Uncharacterised protein [Legionella donaldsonii]